MDRRIFHGICHNLAVIEVRHTVVPLLLNSMENLPPNSISFGSNWAIYKPESLYYSQGKDNNTLTILCRIMIIPLG